jgi:p24 family protein delta-1
MIGLLKLYSCLLLFLSLPFTSALKFDVAAHHGHESAKHERCIRNFVAKDQLVVVTVIVDGSKGDGQQLNMHVRWAPSFTFISSYG